MKKPKIGIIGGTGLGEALCEGVDGKSIGVETPFGAPSDSIIETNWKGVDIALLNRHGAGHMIPPSMVNYRANIYALKVIGCTRVIASGAVGSLREQIAPKHLVIPDQVIDKTYRRTGTFFDDMVAHVEFSSPFCPVLRGHLLNCAAGVETTVHDGGTYVCMEGPAFSSRAESEMHQIWGGDLIGMTAMPEAKLAREAELPYALVALVSDYDCWRPHPAELEKHELLKEILAHVEAATRNAVLLIKTAVQQFDQIAATPCPAHDALELSIWSNKDSIPQTAKDHLRILVQKYL